MALGGQPFHSGGDGAQIGAPFSGEHERSLTGGVLASGAFLLDQGWSWATASICAPLSSLRR
jgi:hypothetical protein